MKFLVKSIWVFTFFLITIPIAVYGWVHWYQKKFEKLPVLGGNEISGKGPSIQHTTTAFSLTNQYGGLFCSEKIAHKIVIANFFFTSCAGTCLNMMTHIRKVRYAFAQDTSICFISFTVDPARDSAARLRKYSERLHMNWTLLTGDKESIYKMARKSYFLPVLEGDGGESDFIHSDQIVLVDKKNHIRGYYSGTDDKAMEQLNTDIKKLENEY